MKVEPLTRNIGALISGVSLGDASRDDALFAEIKAQLLRHKVLFLRDQKISRAEHVAFARKFGPLEDHPIAGSDPEHPGLIRIYRSDKKENYENNYHTDGAWRPCPRRPSSRTGPTGSPPERAARARSSGSPPGIPA